MAGGQHPRESQREDRLFDDPYAQAFVAAAPGAFPGEQHTEQMGLGPLAPLALRGAFYSHAVIWIRFFDDYLTAVAGGAGRWRRWPRAWTPGRSASLAGRGSPVRA